ncbi:MAG: C69 family dipeptidase [Desulfoplanes sp.]|nr:C69 family dipeptidase [Desulfoplanes sp.]
MKLSPWVEDGFTKAYPLFIKPDTKLAVRDVMSLYRDYYQGTEFDLSKGTAADPFGCPYRYSGGMDPKGDTSDPSIKRQGAWERSISIFRCGYSYVCQARGWLPDPIGGIVWFGPDQPMSTCYVPFYVGALRVAAPFITCDTTKFNQKSAWWACYFVANWAAVKYEYMIKDVIQKQDEMEQGEIQGIKAMDEQALALYAKHPAKARELLFAFCENQADRVVKDWWNFAWIMVARYADGFVNAPGKMAQEVGYPKAWYETTTWPQGPTGYQKPAPTGATQ